MSELVIRDLHVDVITESGPKEILKGVDLTVGSGEVHAIMGPNGSGKSTLAYSIAGHPKYVITSGSVTLDGVELTHLKVDERARAGLFLAMQYPIEVPGVSVANFLRTAKTALSGEAPKVRTWVKDVNAALERIGLDGTFASRSLNEGFSGGEKKRNEIAQLELLDPKFAVLDETDSGLDIDALRIVSEGVNRYLADGNHGVLLITHYVRILNYIKPDFVHVFVDGRIVEEGGPELVAAIRDDFPVLARRVGEHPLVYLDSANTSQKPRAVVDAIAEHYLHHNGNVARAMHTLGVEATSAYEGARARIAAFIGARSASEVVFTKNASEALNLAAHTLGVGLRPGDEIVISVLEHHSNIVPWQLLAQRTGAVLRWYDITEEGRLDLDKAEDERLINERTKIVSIAAVSNVLGTVNPVARIAAQAHAVGATMVVDPADRTGGRVGRCRRLPRPGRDRAGRRPRGADHGLRAGQAGADRRRPPPRPEAAGGPGRRDLVHAHHRGRLRGPSARRHAVAGLAGNRRPRRPPLRASAARAAGADRVQPGLGVPVHDH